MAKRVILMQEQHGIEAIRKWDWIEISEKNYPVLHGVCNRQWLYCSTWTTRQYSIWEDHCQK